MGCWAATAQLSTTSLSVPALSLLLNALWGCTNSSGGAQSCTSLTDIQSMMLDAPGQPPTYVPSASVSPTGLLTLYPAPGDLQPSCNIPMPGSFLYPPWCPQLGGATASSIMTYNYTQLVLQALGQPPISDLYTLSNALSWYPRPIPCQGKYARRLSPVLKLDTMMAPGS